MRLTIGALALAVALVAPASAAAKPPKGPPPASEATEWLASQLQPTADGSYCELFGEESVGETLECTLAFKAAGSSFDTQREATYKWALANKARYVGSESCATTTNPLSAGAVAKLALTVEAQGGNPESVEGRNLIADLECLQVGSGLEAGDHRAEGLRSQLRGQTEPESVDRSRRRVSARTAVRGQQAQVAERRVSLDDGPAGEHVQRRTAVHGSERKRKRGRSRLDRYRRPGAVDSRDVRIENGG
jgi:hypothetical protein